jgi:hypothetical protein
MSRSQKVEEIKNLFEAGALTQEEYRSALRRVDEEERQQPPPPAPPPERDAENGDPELTGTQRAKVKKPKPYQVSTNRGGYWTYQDRKFEEDEGLEDDTPWARYVLMAGGALALLFLFNLCG